MATTSTRIGMPLDEFIRLNDQQPFELIDGERIPKLPTVAGHSETIHVLRKALEPHVEANGLGRVFTETTFVLPGAYDENWVEGSRTPDVMFISAERLSAYKQAHPDWRQKPYLIVPDFVAEIVSPTDRYSEIDKKVDAYLEDGVRLIWIIDPERRKAVVYTPDVEQPIHLSGDRVLMGDHVIPGFQIGLQMLFA